MKKIFTLCVIAALTTLVSKAQFTANFDNGITSLSSNCWQFYQIEYTNVSGEVINGTGSLYSNPPVNGSSTRDYFTPALNITSTSLTVSFNYKLSSKISGNATRTIVIGLVDVNNNYTSLDLITLDKNSPTTVQSYSNSFTVVPGVKKLVIKTGGNTGDGNTRVIYDDLNVSANAKYSNNGTCNSSPLAVDDNITGIIGTTVFGNVLPNDNDPDGENMTPKIVSTSNDGTVVLNPDGSFSFTPKANFSGSSTSFTYQLVDDGYAPMTSNTATVTINLVEPASLPVHLISFYGNMNRNNKVTLNWKVADNETVSHFEVEKSANGKDFTTVAVVFATDKTGTEDYVYYETLSNNDKVMFRLRMFDKNQDIDYSKILVFQTKTEKGSNIKVFGNPVNDKLTFSYNSASAQTTIVRVFDMAGRILMNQKVNSLEGSNMLSLPLHSTLKPGMYIVEVNTGSDRQTAKFIKQ